MAHLYYSAHLANPGSKTGAAEIGAVVDVDGDEARHAVRVARLRVGERTIVGDGRGLLCRGAVVSVDRDRFAVRIEDIEQVPKSRPELVLVQALAKGDRAERAVEQSTEFGVDALVPWQAARSVSRWDGAGSAEKSAKGTAKWARVAREAAKQSMRAWVPEVAEPVTTDQLCDLARSDDSAVLVLHPKGERPLAEWAATSLAGSTVVHLVVGPEGGLDDYEIERLQQASAQIVTLGRNVLRTSSAGPAALALLNVTLGRW